MVTKKHLFVFFLLWTLNSAQSQNYIGLMEKYGIPHKFCYSYQALDSLEKYRQKYIDENDTLFIVGSIAKYVAFQYLENNNEYKDEFFNYCVELVEYSGLDDVLKNENPYISDDNIYSNFRQLKFKLSEELCIYYLSKKNRDLAKRYFDKYKLYYYAAPCLLK